MRYVVGILLSCLVLFISSCYPYVPPPGQYLSTQFDPRNTIDVDLQLDQVKELSLNKAKEIALLNNQSYLAVFHSVSAAKMRYYQSLGAYSPVLSMGGSTGGIASWGSNMVKPPDTVAGRETAFSNTAGVTASWLLFDGFARYLNMKIADADFRKETAVDAQVRCMLKRSVAYAFYDYQYADELMRIHQEDAEFQEKLYSIITPEYHQKKRRQDESLNFSIQLRMAQSSRISAENMRDSASFTLSQLMGYSRGELPSTVNIPAIQIGLERIYYSNENCIEIALNSNPELRIMRELLNISEFNVWKSYSNYFPTVFADFSYMNQRYAGNYRNHPSTYTAYTQNSLQYGIHADLLLFNGFSRYNRVREMKAMEAVSKFKLAQTYLDIVNSVNAAYSVYDTAYQQYQIYRQIVPEARLERDLYLQLYLDYKGTTDRIDKVQEYYISAQIQLAQLATNYRKSIAQLEALMMMELE